VRPFGAKLYKKDFRRDLNLLSGCPQATGGRWQIMRCVSVRNFAAIAFVLLLNQDLPLFDTSMESQVKLMQILNKNP
jgi:hypothetical protein